MDGHSTLTAATHDLSAAALLPRLASRGLVRRGLMLGLALGAFQAQPLFAALTVTVLQDAAQNPSTPFGCASLRPDQACTLRAAVQAFNRSGGGPHTINLSVPGNYFLNVGPASENSVLGADAAVGDLDVTVQLIIRNTSGGVVAIDGGLLDRVFHVHAGKRLELYDLAVQKGRAGPAVARVSTTTAAPWF